jgi:hypothetical protein
VYHVPRLGEVVLDDGIDVSAQGGGAHWRGQAAQTGQPTARTSSA